MEANIRPLIERMFLEGGFFAYRVETCNLYVQSENEKGGRLVKAQEVGATIVTLAEFEKMLKGYILSEIKNDDSREKYNDLWYYVKKGGYTMNYSLLIENRRSVREFTTQHICPCALTKIKDFYNESCRRLDGTIKTALLVFGTDARQKLEGAAGYERFLIGAPNYLVLLSEKTPLSGLNAGYIMQDISLKEIKSV